MSEWEEWVTPTDLHVTYAWRLSVVNNDNLVAYLAIVPQLYWGNDHHPSSNMVRLKKAGQISISARVCQGWLVALPFLLCLSTLHQRRIIFAPPSPSTPKVSRIMQANRFGKEKNPRHPCSRSPVPFPEHLRFQIPTAFATLTQSEKGRPMLFSCRKEEKNNQKNARQGGV